MKDKRGMILICTLAIMIILTIFLLTAVHQTQSSTMVAKRAMWDIKSYWSAIAGNTIAKDGCLRDYRWPQTQDTTKFLTTAGGYTIAKDEHNIINGLDESSNSKFSIYYKNELLDNSNNKSTTPSENAILTTHFNNILNKTPDPDKEKREIYCLSVGKTGPSAVGLELVYGLYYNPNLFGDAIGTEPITQDGMQNEASISAAGAIYVKGNLEADLRDFFTIGQENGTRGYIVVGGNVDINSKNSGECDPYGNGPVKIGEGAIFFGGNHLNNGGQTSSTCWLNGVQIPPDNNSNINNFGVSVYTSPEVNINTPNFNTLENTVDFPEGMFCFIELPNIYDKVEFNKTVQELFEVSITPEEFLNLYAQPLFDQDANYDPANDSTIPKTLEELKQYFSNSETYNYSNYDIQKFETQFNAKYSDFFDTATGNIAKIKPLYECFLLDKCLKILYEYKNDTEDSIYHAYFIPNGNAGINDTDDTISLKYQTFAKARALGYIAKEINECSNSDSTISTNYISGFLTKLYANHNISDNLSQKIREEYGNNNNYGKVHFNNYANSVGSSTNVDNIAYIAEEVNLGENKQCFVLSKLSDYIASATAYTQTAQDISTLLNNVTFISNNDFLIMSINCNLKSDNKAFKFATFERKDNVITRVAPELRTTIPRNQWELYGITNDAILLQQEAPLTAPMTYSSLPSKNRRLASNYIIQQSVPVENMTKFLKLFVSPVMATAKGGGFFDDETGLDENNSHQQYYQTEMLDGGGGGGGGGSSGGGSSSGNQQSGNEQPQTLEDPTMPIDGEDTGGDTTGGDDTGNDPDNTGNTTTGTENTGSGYGQAIELDWGDENGNDPDAGGDTTGGETGGDTTGGETGGDTTGGETGEGGSVNTGFFDEGEDTPVEPTPRPVELPTVVTIQAMVTTDTDSNYISAVNRRAAVRLGTNSKAAIDVTTELATSNSITAKSINIKGYIYGTGHICSTTGDITFEAVGSGIDATAENWVSIWSGHDINIKRVSAIKSSDAGANANLSTADFRGILYSHDNLNVDVGADNLDFKVAGAIICGENMKMQGIKNLVVKYDPNLSSLILSRFVNNWDSSSKYIEEALTTTKRNNNNEDRVLNTGRFKMFNRI